MSDRPTIDYPVFRASTAILSPISCSAIDEEGLCCIDSALSESESTAVLSPRLPSPARLPRASNSAVLFALLDAVERRERITALLRESFLASLFGGYVALVHVLAATYLLSLV